MLLRPNERDTYEKKNKSLIEVQLPSKEPKEEENDNLK